MKTNVTLSSADRELFGITIRQGTNPSFLSVTDLQKAYEKARWQHGWSDKQITNILQNDNTKERVYHLLFERKLIKTDFLVFTQMIKDEGVVNVLKGLGVYKTTGKGPNKTVMADPYIWVLLAMELNPMIYAKVVIWLTDSLIFDRLEAGSETQVLNSAIKKMLNGQLTDTTYSTLYTTMNVRVFGHHMKGMRNLASSAQLKMIANIEKFISSAINAGWIKTEAEVISAIMEYK